jgi:Arc/MetJ-type ribon-helix-helix transcriptional regulator
MPDDNETEKLTINVVPVDLGKMDLLVDQGMFASRSDLIRTAIRRLLDENAAVVNGEMTRRFLNIGVVVLSQKHLASMQKKGERLKIRTIGRLVLRADVTPETADAVIEEVLVKGSIKMSPEVRERIADRIH